MTILVGKSGGMEMHSTEETTTLVHKCHLHSRALETLYLRSRRHQKMLPLLKKGEARKGIGLKG
jgi:hypothetical protein